MLTWYPRRKAVLIKGGASETADALYIGEHETPKCTAAGQVLVKVRTCFFTRLQQRADRVSELLKVKAFGLNRCAPSSSLRAPRRRR